MRFSRTILLVGVCWTALTPLASSQAPSPVPILLDADLGSDIDDAFALSLAIASPELRLEGVTTVSGHTMDRAWIACRFLSHTGHESIEVAAGGDPQPAQEFQGYQFQYRYHPAVIFNRTSKPVAEPAHKFLFRKLKSQKAGYYTIVALGPLTNIARHFQDHPESKAMVKRIILTCPQFWGGSICEGTGAVECSAEMLTVSPTVPVLTNRLWIGGRNGAARLRGHAAWP